jgi:hypothetical protein
VFSYRKRVVKEEEEEEGEEEEEDVNFITVRHITRP